MRFRMGKGQVIVFDAFIEKKLEEMRTERGFYPTLKEIGAQCTPIQPADCIFRALRRLAAAGRLSKEALQVYNAKNNLKNKQENTNEKTNDCRKTETGKTKSRAAKK